MKENSKNVCLYHADCIDGFSAAWVTWKGLGEDVAWYPVRYGDVWSVGLKEKVKGKNVWIVDFCFREEVIVEIANVAEKVVVIDHHVGMVDVMEKIQRIDNVESIYGKSENGYCGAKLAWWYFFPNKTWPRVLDYIASYDTGGEALLDQENVIASVSVTEKNMLAWDSLMQTGISTLAMEGRGIRMLMNKIGRERVEKGAERMFLGKTKVMAVNAPREIRQEVAKEVWRKYGDDEIALIWELNGKNRGEVVCSLRGKEVEVLRLAQEYGGGGHKFAAGFKLIDRQMEDFLIGEI